MTEREIRHDERKKAAELLDSVADDVVGGMRRPIIIRTLRMLASKLRQMKGESDG